MSAAAQSASAVVAESKEEAEVAVIELEFRLVRAKLAAAKAKTMKEEELAVKTVKEEQPSVPLLKLDQLAPDIFV